LDGTITALGDSHFDYFDEHEGVSVTMKIDSLNGSV
jgi:hypothetical protein